MSGDWLALEAPSESDDSWLESAEKEPAPISPWMSSAMELPENEKERYALVEKAWNQLKYKQQLYLMTLRRHRFSQSDALKSLQKTRDAPDRHTVARWARNDENYAFVLKAMKIVARNEIVDPDLLLLRTNEIAEKALERTPILYMGQPTGFYEHDLRTALSATETLMKTQKMINPDEQRSAIVGPGLVIQIVQSDGGLRDVTPGVTIDLPAPETTEVTDGA